MKEDYQGEIPTPRKGAVGVSSLFHGEILSIHTPYIGSDPYILIETLLREFQSALPVWGATLTGQSGCAVNDVKILTPCVSSKGQRRADDVLSQIVLLKSTPLTRGVAYPRESVQFAFHWNPHPLHVE